MVYQIKKNCNHAKRPLPSLSSPVNKHNKVHETIPPAGAIRADAGNCWPGDDQELQRGTWRGAYDFHGGSAQLADDLEIQASRAVGLGPDERSSRLALAWGRRPGGLVGKGRGGVRTLEVEGIACGAPVWGACGEGDGRGVGGRGRRCYPRRMKRQDWELFFSLNQRRSGFVQCLSQLLRRWCQPNTYTQRPQCEETVPIKTDIHTLPSIRRPNDVDSPINQRCLNTRELRALSRYNNNGGQTNLW
jgi:hypothetical protein